MRFLITSWRQTFRAFLFFSSNFDIAKRFSIVFILFSSKWSYLSPWWESARNAFQMLSNIPQLDFVLFRCTCASPARGLKRTIIVYKGQISWITEWWVVGLILALCRDLVFIASTNSFFRWNIPFFVKRGGLRGLRVSSGIERFARIECDFIVSYPIIEDR